MSRNWAIQEHDACIAILNWKQRAVSRADISVCQPHTTDMNWEQAGGRQKRVKRALSQSRREPDGVTPQIWIQCMGLCNGSVEGNRKRKDLNIDGNEKKNNIMKSNGQDKKKDYAWYCGRDTLLLTSARLRRSLPQKDVEILSFNTFKNRLNKPQWARLSSSYSHRAITHACMSFEAWEPL